MDRELGKWQNLWHQQKSNQLDIDKLISQLKKVDKSLKHQRVFIPLLFSVAIYLMIIRLSWNTFNILSISLIVTGMVFLILPLFKASYDLKNIRQDINNVQFVENYIKLLYARKLIPKRYFLLFILFFIVALNIAFIGALSESTLTTRIFAHLSCFALFLLLLFVRKIGQKKYEKEISSLITQLRNLLPISDSL